MLVCKPDSKFPAWGSTPSLPLERIGCLALSGITSGWCRFPANRFLAIGMGYSSKTERRDALRHFSSVRAHKHVSERYVKLLHDRDFLLKGQRKQDSVFNSHLVP